jgi:Uma2 family endonuclease
MAQRQAKQPRMTFDEFLEWERRQETKHEFLDGVPVAMAGASEAHNIIQANLLASSLTKLRGGPCRPFPSDMLVRTGTGKGRYPDMTIDCGPRNPSNLVAPNPVIVFEVLSPETQREDRTLKLADYNATPSIAHYVLVEPSEPLVHIYHRGPHGDFNLRPQELRGLDARIELEATGLTLMMSEIYDGLDVDLAGEAEPSGNTPSPS